ncbi:MAG: chromate transporter [Eubacteriales bacterium]|nr:chromate transporter [Eubacteriales bacterium]
MIMYLRIIWIFFKIGLFTIGGGYAMLPLINSELVAYGLMTQLEVADIVAVSQMTPGPFAINAATFSGVRTLGIPGGIAATVAVALPSLIITTLLAKYFFKFEDNIIVRRAMWGIRPAVTGLIAAAAVIMAVPALFGADSLALLTWGSALKSIDLASVVIALATGVAILKFKVSPILMILLSGVAGVVLFGVLGL